MPGPYRIANIHSEFRATYTNLQPTGAVRGAGRPQGVLMMERMMDRMTENAISRSHFQPDIKGFSMWRSMLVTLLVVLVTVACASPSTTLVNSGRRMVRCASSGSGYVGAPQAVNIHDKCVRDYRAAGYIELNEMGDTGIRNVTTDGNVVRILKVMENSPASNAGISAGDLITKVNGQPVTKVADVMLLVFGKVGSTVEVTVSRDNQERPISLVLDSWVARYGTK